MASNSSLNFFTLLSALASPLATLTLSFRLLVSIPSSSSSPTPHMFKLCGDTGEDEGADVFRMFTTIASNDFPTSRLPTLLSRSHTCAPPRVASQNRVGIVSGLDANESEFDDLVGDVIATTLAAIDACWIAVRIEGENPPETSVPRPTCQNSKVRGGCQ